MELETNLQKQKEYIDLLKEDIEGLKKDKATLKQYLKGNMTRSTFVRQGLKSISNGSFWIHYLVFPVTGIPLNLNIKDIRELIEEVMQPLLQKGGSFEGYQIEKIDYSERKKIWYVQVWSTLVPDME